MDQKRYERDITRNRILSLALAVAVLLIAVAYILAYVYLVPYPGFDYNSQWRIVGFVPGCGTFQMTPPEPTCDSGHGELRAGDQILAIRTPDGRTLTRDDYDRQLWRTPFASAKAGDLVELTVLRQGTSTTVAWEMSGPTTWMRVRRLASLLLFLPFWLAGTIVLLTFRPRDERWYVLIAVNYLTGLWSTVGDVSFSQIGGSVILLVVLSWLLMALYLHLHLLIPEEVPRRRRIPLLWLLYGAAIVGATLNLLRVLPLQSYYIALFLGLVGSLGILIYRALRPITQAGRAAALLMLTGIGVSMLPGILLWLAPRLFDPFYTPESIVTILVTLPIPLLPFFYIYALYKHRLGEQEVRANRALSHYTFFVLFSTFFMFVFVVAAQWIEVSATVYGFALAFSAGYVLLAFGLRGPYNRLMERLAYGVYYDPESIVQAFANEIPQALTPMGLADVLRRQVLPTMMVRQSALFWLKKEADASPLLLYQENIAVAADALAAEHLERAVAEAGRFLLEGLPEPFQWVRLVIPVRLDERLVGLWLFGSRDPDDFYPYRDISLLTTLANQVGVALEIARLFDIERERAAELERINLELRRTLRIKEDMLRNISHELRTPLTAISGYTELLRDGVAGDLTTDQLELLQVVEKNTGVLRDLINDLIAYQQTRAQESEIHEINIVDIARTCITEASATAGKMGYWNATPPQIELESEEPVICARVNSTQIGQVFNNLLSNAVKFSPDGGRVLVSIRKGVHVFASSEHPGDPLASAPPRSAETPALLVSVEDQGIGIPPEELDNIWLDFYQVDGSATRRFGGTGLGLALVKEIILAHGGDVWVESEVGVGSTFHFALPLTDPSAETKVSSA